MIETICPSCGNRKPFEDSFIGRKFKCPKCSNPVTIQPVGSLLMTEPDSQTNSFTDEIARAAEEKKRKIEEEKAERKRQAEEERNKKEIEEKKNKNKVYRYIGGFLTIWGILTILAGEDGQTLGIIETTIGLWLFMRNY